MSLDVMRSEMRLCRFLTAFHAWKPPKLEFRIVRMRFGQSRAQQGPAALFFERVCSIVYCLLPRQLFLGWHCDPGSQSDFGILCNIGNDSDGARSASGPPCGASSWGPASIFLPIVFSVTQRPDWSASNVLTAAGPIRMLHLPGPNATLWDLR